VSGDHYFSPSPQSEESRHPVSMTLAGHEVTLSVPSGTFSADGLDRGTQVLLNTAPTPPAEGLFVDVGCGWGPIALSLALHSQNASVWAIDVNDRARQATRDNAGALGLENLHACSPEEFPTDKTIDLIWSNPPIRIGKAALHELLATWLNRLSPEGEAWLVVAKQLGSDSLQRWLNDGGAGAFLAERMDTEKGYRVLRVTRA
jgi:16S rRNA (guanine1207-N2)-methyltransferase